MVQPLKPVSATPIRKNTTFGNKEPAAQVGYRRHSKTSTTIKETARYLGAQFTLGAVATGIFKGTVNLIRLITRNPLIPLKQICEESIIMGSWCAAFGAAFMAAGALVNKLNKKEI